MAAQKATWPWAIFAFLLVCLAWWWFDPAGFYQNPVLTWFRGLSVTLPAPATGR
jgi:hypothetical protein